jgi:natural product biosynthesis luciferase-like monooxygenase protein/amino acid adenylation domain-containing protein
VYGQDEEPIPMNRTTVADLYILSPIQKGMLFHVLYNPESGMYFEQFTWTFHSSINVAAFARAWQQMLDRYPILRTGFYWEGLDEPMQMVQRRVQLPLEQHDWRDLPGDQQDARLEAYLKADRQRGFELATAPLLRLTLIQVSDESYHFILSYHHLLLDGWSLMLVLKEAFALYEAFSQGQTVSLKPSRPYRDYIAWLRQQDLAEAETFWRTALSGFSAPTPLRVDRDTGNTPSTAEDHAKQDVLLSVATTTALHALTRQQHLTFNTLVQGAWALLLSCYSGETDVVYGTTVSGRPADLAGSDAMVGMFINTLPMRVRIAPEMPLLAWLQQFQKQQVELRAYEYTPLVELQRWSDVPSGLPLFESIVVFEKFPVEFAGTMRDLRVFQRTNYPLTVLAEPGPSLLLRISYERHRFDSITITQMLCQLATVLEGMAANPEQRLMDLPLLTAAQRQQLLVEWNSTHAAYPLEQCLHQLIDAQVARSPDAIAVVFEDQLLTYRELDRRANQLAHALHAREVGPDVRVAICMERSLELVIGLLGILKAGGAYVPLDPAYPPERLAYMLEDSQARVLLLATSDDGQGTKDEGQARSVVVRPSSFAGQVLDLRADWPAIARSQPEPLRTSVSPDNVAYMIYTSGSTGTPKGAMNTHRAIVNRLLWMQETYALTPADRVLQKTPFSFDVSVWEFFWPLLSGARLILARPEEHRDSAYLVALIAAQQITTLHFVPSMLQVFLEQPHLTRCASLRHVICSGEALPYTLQERFFARLDAELHNLYGPTEAAVDVSWWACVPGDPRQVVPIGHPIANIQLYVLDPHMQPVPIGVPGELHIGGVGLARGYLNRPSLTAERFVPNPFLETNDERRTTNDDNDTADQPFVLRPASFVRLYKTGDLVRQRPDGAIEFLGRIDYQVKLRGFRIELGEIEAVLGGHPAVREAVVLVRADAPGDQRLVAYIVPTTEDRRDTLDRATTADEGADSSSVLRPSSLVSELRDFLITHLPDYMVPATFVLLEALPLTPNGKLDRRALPAPEQAYEPQAPMLNPRTPIEELLLNIWTKILGVKNMGIHDSFLALGGHSLLATQVFSRLRETFGVDLPLRIIFEARTIAGLAKHIELALQAGQNIQAPPLRPFPRDGDLPLSFAQQRLWFLNEWEPNRPLYTVPTIVQLVGPFAPAILQRSIEEIVRRHEALRTSFPTVDGQPIQVVGAALPVPMLLLDLRGLPPGVRGRESQQLIRQEVRRPFDLARGPLLRVVLIRREEEEHVLLLTMHHIISDEWSLGVFFREMAALYTAFSNGQPSPLPELPIQYADFAQWQMGWLQGETLETQLAYWKKQLGGAPATLALPIDRPRPSIQTFRGAAHSFLLPSALVDALKTYSRQEGVTLFMTLLAAFQTLLYRYTAQDDIVVSTPIAGRNRAEIEDLIGLFVNTLVLRTDLSGNPRFQELVRRVQKVALDAYAHQDLPFEQLVEALQPERDLSHTPLFQVMFVFQNAPLPALELPGLTLRPLEMGTGTTKFNITLSMRDTDQGLNGWLEYSIDLFDAATMVRMAGHLQRLLQGMVAHPNQHIAELPLLTEAERCQVLVEWNATGTGDWGQRAAPGSFNIHHSALSVACIHQLFEAQAARTPDALAIVHYSSLSVHLAYRELNRRANQLAWYLRRLGVGPEVRVGICMERSPEALVSLLGVLKAGGAYVPLDPAYPSDRLAFMLDDSQAAVLLIATKDAGPRQLVSVSASHPTLVDLRADWAAIAQGSAENPPHTTTADHPAYVIYTSGSTGHPKGVIGLHRGFLNRAGWMWSAYPFEADAISCQKTALSFVDSIWEVFGPLLQGVPNVIIPEDVLHDPDQFIQTLARWQVTRMVLVPSLLQSLLDARPNLQQMLPRLRHWISSGEALPLALLRRFQEHMPQCLLLNLYGSSEIAADALWYDTRQAARMSAVPIGRPIANTVAYLLDEALQPVPIGVVGEIFIGGLGLARGYFNRPDLTAERFVPNPFADERRTTNDERRHGDTETRRREAGKPATQTAQRKPHNSRLYRTGDLGRYRPDGMIEYLGRADQQVKVRGFRVELGEIDAALAAHPAVRETAVVARQDAYGDTRLIAYVVPDQAHLQRTAAMPFSLFYFAADDTWSQQEKYRLYVEGAKYADQHGFTAVWTPERHFHEVAGLYPNPSVLSAALAMVTERIQLRAGSVVLPLHHPARVAEEWAVVDNLSNGRVGLSFVSGWIPNDFAFFPEHFATKREVLFRGIEEVRQLWRGEAISTHDGVGNPTKIAIFPRPIQPELPIWLTCTRDPDMFVKAGELGANVLTALLGQTVEEASANIARYRESLARHGHDPAAGQVAMMLHTFVHPDRDAVLAHARAPFCTYMRSHVGLIETLVKSLNSEVDIDTEQGLDDLVNFAFERYYQTASLIGTPERCGEMIERLREIGVDEVACLIDFGVEVETVLASLESLNEVRERSACRTAPSERALRQFLQQRLPAYMVPADFVLLDTLPLTPNGKVDRRALPAPDVKHPELAQGFVLPRTTVEEALAELWTKVLGVEQIGVYDNFFYLGGHSLSAARVMIYVRDQFQVDLSVQTFFEHPTIAGMAQIIEQVTREPNEIENNPIPALPIGEKGFVDLLDEIEQLSDVLEHLSEEEALELLGRTDLEKS